MNQYNKKSNPVIKHKLILSKWTARYPQNNEIHFIVNRWLKPEEGQKDYLELEAVLTKNLYHIHFKELKNFDKWKIGWH